MILNGVVGKSRGMALSPPYKIATNNFMATGGDQFDTFTEEQNFFDTQLNFVDTVVKNAALF